MLRTKGLGVWITHGKELIRIRGVYMYVILYSGRVAALTGHKTLTLTTFEDHLDEESPIAFLRVGRWVYPLARKYSPVIITDENSIVMPDPMSKSFEESQYIAVKLPEQMTFSQKKILQKFLHTFAHLKGFFKILRGRSYSLIAPYAFGGDERYANRGRSSICFDIKDTRDEKKVVELKMRCKTFKYRHKSINIPLCIRPLKRSLLRLYTDGPQDPVFVQVETNAVWVKLGVALVSAVRTSLKRLKERYVFKRDLGLLPVFDRRFEFHYLPFVSREIIVKAPIKLDEDTKWAALMFEEVVKRAGFELVDFELQPRTVPFLKATRELESGMITHRLITQYLKGSLFFTYLCILSDIESCRWEFKTPSSPRIKQICDHSLKPFYECYAE